MHKSWARSFGVAASLLLLLVSACGDKAKKPAAADGGDSPSDTDAAVGGQDAAMAASKDAAVAPAKDAGDPGDAAEPMDAAEPEEDSAMPAAAVGTSTGNVIVCADGTTCDAECAETGAASPANCAVFVSNRYSIQVMGNVACGATLGLNFNGGTPAAGTFDVGGVNDYAAGKVAVSYTGDSIEYAMAGTVTVTVDGTEITATFEDLEFPSGAKVSAEITCH
jgi:hypothetical protein